MIKITWADWGKYASTPCIPNDRVIPESDLLKAHALRSAMKHLAVERGGKHARSEGFRLVRKIKHIAALAARQGVEVHICTTNQTTAPSPWDAYNGLGLELRGVKDSRIVWNAAVYSHGNDILYRIIPMDGYDPVYHTASRADVFLRRLPAFGQEAKE